MDTLSKGYKKPVREDTGDKFFPAMQTNIQLMNDHVHDGISGAVLTPGSQTILAASWAAVAGKIDTYSQVVTMPTGYSYDTVGILFRLSTGQPIYPSVDRVSATTYRVYVNDNTLALTAQYVT